MLSKIRTRLTTFSIIIKESILAFLRNNDFGIAASLAYYGLFALIPMFLIALYLLGHYILSSREAMLELKVLVTLILPGASTIILKEAGALAQHSEIWGVTGLLTLFWAIIPLVTALRNAFFYIFRVSERPPLIKSKLRDAAVVFLILSQFLFLVISQVFYSQVMKAFVKKMPLLVSMSNVVAPLLITAFFMFIFYYVLVPVQMRLKHLIIGSLVTSLSWALLRPLFSQLVTYNPAFGIAFGSLKAIFIILLWVYCSFSVILFGAEIMVHMRKKEVLLLKRLFDRGSPVGDAAMVTMKRLIRDYPADEPIIVEGDSGNSMFYILSGSVRISKHGQVLNVLAQGEYFGEMAMLLNAPRVASAQAVEDTQLILISQDNFETLLREEPKIVMAILKKMALRLTETNQLL
jgi:membrane protein